MLLKNSSC
uniref:Uncharacterized protein n=1 Tax=Rhizophora mucronata TaxID=61149 RepID=A0A2P2QW92_RHIMU